MTTPYGTTTFTPSSAYVHTGENLVRYLEATDPLGQKERVEFNISPLTGIGGVIEPPQPDSSVVSYLSDYANYRNSFYWDKLAMKLAPGDYKKAHVYHWLHKDANEVTGVLESEVRPYEGRIFYNYDGQPSPSHIGRLGFPSVVARVVKDPLGNNQTQASKFVYNGFANLERVTDPAGRTTIVTYAPNQIDVTAVAQKTGASTTVALASATYGNGAPPHRPATTTDGAGNTTSYSYSPNGQVLSITNAKSETTTFAYETNSSVAGFGRVVSVTGDVPGGNRSFTYDAFGRLRTASDADGSTLTYDYDTLDRLRKVTYPDATFEQLEYEDHSLVATRDRQGRWTRHLYNPLLERVVTQDPELRTSQFQWCRCGELKRFVDANGHVTEWERDEGRRVKKKTYADGSFETFSYDLSGRLSTTIDAMSRTVGYSYAIDDRLVKKDYSDPSTPDVTYAYDPWFPRVSTVTDGSGTTTFAYVPHGQTTNGAGQVALVNGPLANDTQRHTYDELGRLKKLEIVSDASPTVASYAEEYAFDARGRVTTVTNNLGATTYAYAGQSSRPTTVGHANGMQVQFDYFGVTSDFALKQIKNVPAGAILSVISQFDYTYEPDRRIATWTVNQGAGPKTWTFGYDEARQLTSATLRDASSAVLESNTYAYDKAGNRVQAGTGTTAPKNYEVSELNQLVSERGHGPTTFAGYVNEPARVTINGTAAKVTSTDGGAPFRFEGVVDLAAGPNTVVVEAKDGQNNVSTKTYAVTATGSSKTYEYDANGNLRYERLPNGTVVREFRWDQQNRLLRVLEGTHESVYDYDGASRRVRIKTLTSGVETKQETFVWCGARICQKRSGSTVLRSYFGNGFQESGPTNYFYTRDHLGSVRDVVESDGTRVASSLSYDPSGKVNESGPGSPRS
jgi:YD repeat-containing protein